MIVGFILCAKIQIVFGFTSTKWIKTKKTSKARGEISKDGIKSPKAVVQSCRETHQSSFFAVIAILLKRSSAYLQYLRHLSVCQIAFTI